MSKRWAKTRSLAAAALICGALAGCTKAAAADSRKLKLEPCRPKGFGREASCGVLEVFEDREAKTGRKLDLRVVVLPALASEAQPDPLFLLAGGPGQAATEAFAPLLPALSNLRRSRDLVFVDQRGTGGSNKLQCELYPKGADLKTRFESKLDPEKLAGCKDKLAADLRLYTTPIAMDDLDDVRAALGYPRINLWGGSYGTRAALVYARQHPDRVRALVLDGVAPVSLRLPLYFARDAQRSLELTLNQCAADIDCKARFPTVRADFEALLARLDAQPAQIKIEDPLTSAMTDLVVTRRRFVDNLRAMLYSPELTALLPLTVDRAAHGDFRAFVAQADAASGGIDGQIAVGMFLSVICAEDAPFISPEEIERLAQGSFLGGHQAREFLAGCKIWPRGRLPDGFREAVHSEAPVLLLSGELDPVTPPGWAEEALKTLPNGTHLVAAGVGHGVTSLGCFPDLVQKFIESGTAKNLDSTCAKTMKRPPFFLSFAGPTP